MEVKDKMPNIRDVRTLQEKWARKAAQAAPDYEQGVSQPLTDWQQATTAAREAWAQGVQQAVQRNAFAAGVQRAGTQKWQQGALRKGARRFAEGVQVAQELGAWQQGFEPFAQVIQNTNLPPRGPKGDPRNIERVAAMARALREAKLRRTGGGR